jgi:hypothetical protein
MLRLMWNKISTDYNVQFVTSEIIESILSVFGINIEIL